MIPGAPGSPLCWGRRGRIRERGDSPSAPKAGGAGAGEFPRLWPLAPRRPGSATAEARTRREERETWDPTQGAALVVLGAARRGPRAPNRPAPTCPRLPALAHLEGGRLPDIAGGDAQQQEAGEARRGQQQRRQQ
jgi:hypothetical protein